MIEVVGQGEVEGEGEIGRAGERGRGRGGGDRGKQSRISSQLRSNLLVVLQH